MKPVWVRGVGALTPLGGTWAESLRALAAGRSAVRPIAAFDATGFPCTVAAAVEGTLDGGEDRRLSLARVAAEEAWSHACVDVDPARIGVFVGAESGRASFGTILRLARAAGGGATFDEAAFARNAPSFAASFDASVVSPAAVASALALRLGAGGPCETVSLACASGSAAVVEGARAIRLGECDVALCGGVGADVDPLMLAGFGLLGMLSSRGVSCPFDVRRDGMVVGEGAAFVVLAAEPGDATVEIAGLGRSLDAWHLTAPDPEGSGALRAMAAALADAGEVKVDAVQAHGTSTPLNDAVEARAIARLFGSDMPVSSVKGAVGHWIAGAGAIGILCAIEAAQSGLVLPTAGLTVSDPECAVRHVCGEALRMRVRTALCNSFAFGGANSCIVVRRRE